MKETGKKQRSEEGKGNELEDAEHDTEYSTGERYDNFDLGIIDRREGERFKFVVVLYHRKLDLSAALLLFVLWDWATKQMENLVFTTSTNKIVT